jgi:hypothetical protein
MELSNELVLHPPSACHNGACYHFFMLNFCLPPVPAAPPPTLSRAVDCLQCDPQIVAFGVQSLHWHGFHMRGAQWEDGVAYVSQCPIITGQSYTYEFTVRGKGPACRQPGRCLAGLGLGVGMEAQMDILHRPAALGCWQLCAAAHSRANRALELDALLCGGCQASFGRAAMVATCAGR